MLLVSENIKEVDAEVWLIVLRAPSASSRQRKSNRSTWLAALKHFVTMVASQLLFE